MMSLPTTSKETATISPGRGVRLNYLYYWADAFRDPLVERTRAPVRYDPYDVGIAYAFVRKRWVRCISEHYRIFRGHSEQELLLAAAELHQRQRKMTSEGSITARRLANFLKSVEAEELLLAQRLRDEAVKQSLDVIESDSDLTSTTQAVGQDNLHEGQGETTMTETSAESSSESDCRELLPDY
jgi:putative transposase